MPYLLTVDSYSVRFNIFQFSAISSRRNTGYPWAISALIAHNFMTLFLSSEVATLTIKFKNEQTLVRKLLVFGAKCEYPFGHEDPLLWKCSLFKESGRRCQLECHLVWCCTCYKSLFRQHKKQRYKRRAERERKTGRERVHLMTGAESEGRETSSPVAVKASPVWCKPSTVPTRYPHTA